MRVYLTASGVFCCSYSHSKRSFYRSFNAFFWKNWPRVVWRRGYKSDEI